jgi:serine/threonine protein kinase
MMSGRSFNTELIWKKEVKLLEQISKLEHPHLIDRIAAISRNERYFLLFEWANGGNLRQFWKKDPKPSLNAARIMEVLEQFYGLAKALCILHNLHRTIVHNDIHTNTEPEEEAYSQSNAYATPEINVTHVEGNSDDVNGDHHGTTNLRHGDLKPDNILRFEETSTWLGILKIADLGLAKQHQFETGLRDMGTSEVFATLHYEAPEAVTHRTKARSRLYDMWSMGCIIFETILWLLYGQEVLDLFYHSESQRGSIGTLYYTLTSQDTAVVNENLTRLMEYILANDPECNDASGTALRDLLRLVQDNLLVVALPTKDDNAQSQFRIDTDTLCRKLASIKEKSENNDKYLFTGKSRAGVGVPILPGGGRPATTHQQQLSPNDARQPHNLHVRQGSSPPTQGMGLVAPPNRRVRYSRFLVTYWFLAQEWKLTMLCVF